MASAGLWSAPCGDGSTPAPVHRRGRVHRHPAAGQPARGVHRRPGPARRADAAGRARAQPLRDRVLPAARAGRRPADPDLHPGQRAAVRRPSRARIGVPGRGTAGDVGGTAGDGRRGGARRAAAQGRADRVRPDGAADTRLGALRAPGAAAGRPGRGRLRPARRGLPERAAARVRRARRRGGGGRAAAGPRRAGRPGRDRRQLLRGRRGALEDPDVRARPRRARGPGDRLGRGPARHPPGPARPDRLRRGDRDPPGRGDRPALRAVRARGRLCRNG